MITDEMLEDALTRYFLEDFMDYLPVKAKVKRKRIEGTIERNLTEEEQAKLSLNECLNQEENNYIIEYFYNILQSRLSHCNLSSFYRNIQSLVIVEEKKTLKERLSEILGIKKTGEYAQWNNTIRIYQGKTDPENKLVNRTKTHELIHMATSRKVGDSYLCGFSHSKGGHSFGYGLNEGYTELINRRYFAGSKANGYYLLQETAYLLEGLIGPREMEQFFFNNDLDGVIQTLEKITTREHALEMLEKMDAIIRWGGKPGGQLIKRYLARQVRVDIANIKLDILKKRYESGQITEEELKIGMFNLELSTHGYSSWSSKDRDKKVTKKGIGGILSSDIRFWTEPARYSEIIDKYYESKKNDPRFTYYPWKGPDGMGIEQIIIQESNACYIRDQEIAKGRNPQEVNLEISRMLSEGSPEIPSHKSIIPKKKA